MTIPFILLAALVAFIPAFAIIDDTWTKAAVSAILTATLMIISIMIPVRHLDRLKHLLQPTLVVALTAPALLMALQVSPMPVHALANPIWASASAALNQKFTGATSIDIGATLLSLAQYCTVVAAFLATMVVTLDRQRASQLLHLLIAISTLVATGQIVLALGSSELSFLRHAGDRYAQVSVTAIVGALLSCAAAIRAFDQLWLVGRTRQANTASAVIFSGALLSFAICACSILLCSNSIVAIAVLFGSGVILAGFVIRRQLLSRWGALAAVALALISAFATVAGKDDADITIAPPMQLSPTTARILSDALPAGSGAGTFNALLPIYREFGSPASEHPSAAAAVAIEMGWPFLCGLILLVLLGAWTLFSRSLTRGHDYVYSAAGSGALIALGIVAFVNCGILNFGASLLVGILLGLAFAQSLSGAARNIVSLELQTASDEKDGQLGRTRAAPWFIIDRFSPRFVLVILGLLLTEQAAWISFAEIYPPVELSESATGVTHDTIANAASIAKMRGDDLWAHSGFSLPSRLSTDPAPRQRRDNHLDQALNAFTNALHYSPHRGDVWLMVAALVNRYGLPGYNISALLKMSYYTAPNESNLLPLRLYVALAGNIATNDPELSELIKHDITLALSHKPALLPALIAAYRLAPADRKAVAENLISQVDPSYLNAIGTR